MMGMSNPAYQSHDRHIVVDNWVSRATITQPSDVLITAGEFLKEKKISFLSHSFFSTVQLNSTHICTNLSCSSILFIFNAIF